MKESSVCIEDRASRRDNFALRALGPDEFIVQLKAFALTPQRSKAPASQSGGTTCLVSGAAAAVVQTGAPTTRLQPGEMTCIYPVFGCGACDLCVSGEDYLCAKRSPLSIVRQRNVRLHERDGFFAPANFSAEEVAALGSAYLPAWRMLINLAKIKPGEFVFIIDFGNEVTIAALHIALQMRCRPIVGTSGDRAFVTARDLGAEHIVDLSCDFVKEVRGITHKHGADVAVSCAAGEWWMQTLECLSRGGRLVTSRLSVQRHGQTDLQRIFWNHLKIMGSDYGSRTDLGQVLQFCQSTDTHPVIDRIFSRSELTAAQAYLNSRAAIGSVIVREEQ